MSNEVRTLRPVFTGKTVNGEEITIYQHVNRPTEIHILLPNNELCKLSASAEVNTWMDFGKEEMRVDIVSPEWTGQARGSKWDLLSVEMR